MSVRPRGKNESVLYQICLGGREFLQEMIEKKRATQVVLAVSRPTLNEIKQAVADVREEPWDKFAGRHGDWGRDIALRLASELSGKTLPAIATAFGMKRPSAICMAIRRLDQRMAKDKALRKLYSQVEALLQCGKSE